MSYRVNSCELADLTKIKDLSTNGFSAKFSNVMLLGRVRGRVEDPETYLGKRLALDVGCALWVLDVFGVKDINGEMGAKGAGETYCTMGTVVFSGPDVSAVEGSLVYLRGAKKIFNGKSVIRPLALDCKLESNKWTAFAFGRKEDNIWIVVPCTIGALKKSQLSNPELLKIAEGIASTGKLEYPENAWERGILSWNGNGKSDDEGVALPSKGSIAWKYQNQEGYSFLNEEGRATWGDSSERATNETNPENKLGYKSTKEEIRDYTTNSITGEGFGKKHDTQDAFSWNADRHGEEGVGFGNPNDSLVEAVKEGAGKWSDAFEKMFVKSRDSVPTDFILEVGKLWEQEVIKGIQRQVFASATGSNRIRRMLNIWVVSEMRKLDLAVYSDFGRIPKSELDRRGILPKASDYADGSVSALEIGAKVILLSTGIRREDTSRGLYWYSRSASLSQRLMTADRVARDVISHLVGAAKCVVEYGQNAAKIAGMPEFAMVGHDRLCRSYGCSDLWKDMLDEYSATGILNKENATDNLFIPASPVSSMSGCIHLEINAEEAYSSKEWLTEQCNEIGCFLDIEEDSRKTTYFSMVDAARSINLWQELSEVENYSWNTPDECVNEAIAAMEEEKGFSLDSTQKEAVRVLSSGGLGVLTGVAGSGKSTVLKCVIDAVKRANPKIGLVQAAPTGKAAKRMVETTNMPATTMHSTFRIMEDHTDRLYWLNKAKNGVFDTVDVTNFDAVEDTFYIFDEVSMCGFNLMCKVMAAVSQGVRCKVLFVGDKEQLPPVQDVPVFAEILSISKKAFRLGESHRAAEGSLPTKNAYKVLKGEGGSFDEGGTFKIRQVENADIHSVVLKEFVEGIKKYGIDGCRVVTPYKNARSVEKWKYASAKISNTLGEILEESGITKDMKGAPKGSPVVSWKSKSAQEFVRIGDRVMNVENTRDVPLANMKGESQGYCDIVNGQEGIVMGFIKGSLNLDKYSRGYDKRYLVLVDMSDDATGIPSKNGKYCAFEVTSRRWPVQDFPMPIAEGCQYVSGGNISNLEMSYAETVHKMQGSEVPCVIIPASTECRNTSFFNRALVYTAITRASKEVVLVGDAGGMGTAFAKASKLGAKENPRETVFGYLGLYA
jgi:ATP-dependent exoDNAse (exonuclease V) alpha subunit